MTRKLRAQIVQQNREGDARTKRPGRAGLNALRIVTQVDDDIWSIVYALRLGISPFAAMNLLTARRRRS